MCLGTFFEGKSRKVFFSRGACSVQSAHVGNQLCTVDYGMKIMAKSRVALTVKSSNERRHIVRCWENLHSVHGTKHIGRRKNNMRARVQWV